MNNTEIFNVIQNAVSEASNDKISISNISTFTSINNTCGIKFSATKSGVSVPFFFGFSNDPKYLDYVVFGILNSERNENINKISLDEDTSKNLIQDKFKFKKIISKEESIQIKKLSKWLTDEINGFFMLFKMFNKKLFENEIEEPSKKDIPVKDNQQENTKPSKVHHKKEESYENISTGTWFKIVELPWLFIIFSFIELCNPSLSENQTEEEFSTSLGIACVLFIIGLIGILATIGKKKKIREAKGLSITITNPYSWFISKIGKVLCGTFFFICGFGILFLLSIFKNVAFSSFSGSSSSSGTRSSSSTTSSSYRNTRTISYYCKYCGSKASSISSLTSGSCPKHPNGWCKGNHEPYQGNEKKNYYCEYCGAKASSISSLTSGSCPKHPNGWCKGNHSPYQGSEKNEYFCRYCGSKAGSISSLTSGSCPKHPNGWCKGNHVPSI